MAQLPSGLYSTFGLLCCLLFHPASWEAGATTAHELQKPSESSTLDHTVPPTPGLIHRAPSGHADPNSGPQLTDLPKSVATPKPKRHCNSIANPTHGPDNSKATAHSKTPPVAERNASSQRKDPMIRSGRAVSDATPPDTQRGSSARGTPTSAPRATATCKTTTGKTRVTSNSATTGKPGMIITTLGTSSHKATAPSHDSETNRKNTSSSVKPTDAPKTSYVPSRTPATSKGTEDHRTPFDSNKPLLQTTKHVKETTSAISHEGEIVSASETTTRPHLMPTESKRETVSAIKTTTEAHPMPTESERETVSAIKSTTGRHLMPTESERETVSAIKITAGRHLMPTESERETVSAIKTTTEANPMPTESERETVSAIKSTTEAHPMPTESEGKTTLVNGKMTHISEKSTEHPAETTATTEKATRGSQRSTAFWRKTTPATKTTKAIENSAKTTAALKTTQSPVKVTEGKPTTTCHLNKTKTTQKGPAGSSTIRVELRSITSGALGNTSHAQQNTQSSAQGLHDIGMMRENNPFPAWAIVIVILVAVILLLLFIGLIFLVSRVSRTPHALTPNAEDKDPEDHGDRNSFRQGRNSYPVYLMEQQNLNPNQTPYPR